MTKKYLGKCREYLAHHRGDSVGLFIHKDKAFQSKASHRAKAPRSRQVKFEAWDDCNAAMREVLEYVWKVEEEMKDVVPCPWDFKKLFP